MKNTTKTYIILFLILILEFVNFFYLSRFNNSTSNLILSILWVLILIITILLLKYQNNKVYLSNLACKMIISSLMTCLVSIYVLGMFLGFSKNILFFMNLDILKILILLILIIVSKEIIRYIVAKNSVYNKLGLIILTMVYILYEVSLTTIDTSSIESIFIYICTILLPIISRELLCSYLSYNFNINLSLIYMLAIGIYPYMLPILPNLGDYITSLVFILLPFSIYMSTIKIIKYNSKEETKLKRNYKLLLISPIILLLIIILLLSSGMLRYKMIAIASDSMQPAYSRGDAIIYDQKVDLKDLEIGQVLVFKKDNMVITHRIVSISKQKNKLIIKTKGDNNEIEDNFYVSSDEVLGTAKYIVKVIGYPTVWMRENLRGVK